MILAMAKKALIGLMENDCPMTGDTKAAGLVTVGLAFDMDPRDKREDDNQEYVCLCAPMTSKYVIHGLVPWIHAGIRSDHQSVALNRTEVDLFRGWLCGAHLRIPVPDNNIQGGD